VNKIQRQILFTTSCVYRVDFLSTTPVLSSVFVMSRLVTSAFFLEIFFAHAYRFYCHAVHVCSGCPTGSDHIATVFQSFCRTNQQFRLASFSQVELVWHVCLAVLYQASFIDGEFFFLIYVFI